MCGGVEDEAQTYVDCTCGVSRPRSLKQEAGASVARGEDFGRRPQASPNRNREGFCKGPVNR